MKLALIATALADRSLAARRLRRLAAQWRTLGEVECFVEAGGAGAQGEFDQGIPARPLQELAPKAYDQILYNVADDPRLGFSAAMIRALGGCVYLHDWSLVRWASAAWPQMTRATWRGRLRSLREGGGGRPAQPGLQAAPWEDGPAFNRSAVRHGDSFLVESSHLKKRILTERNAPTPVAVMPWSVSEAWRADVARRISRSDERVRLGLDPTWGNAFLVATQASDAAGARLQVLLEALAQARKARTNMKLVVLAGEPEGAGAIESLVRAAGLSEHVHSAVYASDGECLAWLRASDLSVQLRGSSAQETCDAIARSLCAGRGVIASAVLEQAEMPDECVYKLAVGPEELPRLSSRIVELSDAASVRVAMEAAACSSALQLPSFEQAARSAWDALEAFPRPRVSKRSLFALRVERGAKEGYRRGRDPGRLPPSSSLSR